LSFLNSKSTSGGKSTVFKLASWTFWQITPLFKNCVFWKFQPSWSCGATVANKPTFRRKHFDIFFEFFEIQKSFMWEIHIFQASLLIILTYKPSLKKICSLKISDNSTMWWHRGKKDPLLEFFEFKKSILWEIQSLQASLLKSLTDYSSTKKTCFR